MSSTLYKAVCARLQQVDFTVRLNLCCLCLETVGDSGACVDDEVVINLRGRPFHSLKLANMLKVLMDESFAEVMFILKAVCKQCISSAVASYKFIQHCRENVKKFTKVVNNIEESLDRLVLDDNVKSLYVAIQPGNNTTAMIKRFYDIRRQLVPEDTAFLRFSRIVENSIDLPKTSEDDSEEVHEQTLSNNNIDETVQALMCCKPVVDTEELLDNPDRPNEFKCRICKELFAKNTSLRVHFFRVHRVKDFKCDKCNTGKDKTKFVIQPVKPKDKITDLNQSSETIVQPNKDPLESTEELDTLLQLKDNFHQDDEQNLSECENQKENSITIVQTELLLKDKHDRKVPSPTTPTSIDIGEEYFFEDKTITDICCENCGMKFSTRVRYLTHRTKYKNNDCRGRKGGGEFKCKLCNFTAFYRHKIRKHVQYKHLGVKDFLCSFCNKNCISKAQLETHLRKHTGEKPYRCRYCGQKFAYATSLKHHEYVHTGELPYKCEYCDKAFRTGTSRGEHVKRTHKPENLSCKICGLTFKMKQYLKKHEIRSHATGSKNNVSDKKGNK